MFLVLHKCLRVAKRCDHPPQIYFVMIVSLIYFVVSLQRAEETHAVLSQASLATRVSSIAAPSSRNLGGMTPAVQPRRSCPGQDVVSGGETKTVPHNTFDKAYNGARQSSTLTCHKSLDRSIL